MRDQRTPEEVAIWDAILKLVDSLPEGRGGTSRTPGQFMKGYGDDVEGGPFERFSATSQFKQYNAQGDGVDDVYDIEVTVTRRKSTNDPYWNEQFRDRRGALVINGKHYRIGSDNGRPNRGGFKGFGGRRFKIQMLPGADGVWPDAITVDDLWYQGPIPPKFRELPEFQDNARFVNPEQEPFRS